MLFIKILNLVILLLFSSSTFGTDISNFDIKGIKLGMNKKEIINKLSDATIKKRNSYGKSWVDQIIKNKINGFWLGAEYVISLNHNEKSLTVYREIVFKYEPNFSKIKKQLIKKYGKPDKSAKSKNNKGDFRYQLCWGSCTIKKAPYWNGNVINTEKKSFLITYRKRSENNIFYMVLQLDDRESQSKEDDWDEIEYKKFLKKEKEKATNIDL